MTANIIYAVNTQLMEHLQLQLLLGLEENGNASNEMETVKLCTKRSKERTKTSPGGVHKSCVYLSNRTARSLFAGNRLCTGDRSAPTQHIGPGFLG